MRIFRVALAIVFSYVFLAPILAEDETLPPLVDGKVPQTPEEIWGDYDPQKEPIEAETVKEWEVEGVVLRVVRYRVGVFKGAKSIMAGIYAFPKGGTRLPGLVQVHGGGQSANSNAALTNARRGYACISLNWGGNPLRDGDYRELESPVGTDWGAVDGTHPPKRDPINHFAVCQPNEFTLDAVESPRNSAWLLVAIGVRRGLTFLEQQPEVDGERLGVYGHSMGGKLTVLAAATDKRVKAAVPSCGGISDYPSELGWENSKYCRRLTCPVLFLNPVNDFYGKVDDLNRAAETLSGELFRFSSAPNLDHRDRPEHFVAGPLWFDQQLRGESALPQTPETRLEWDSIAGVLRLCVMPDPNRTPRSVDVYFNQSPRDEKCANPCWRYAPAAERDAIWTAELPLLTVDRALRVYANARYSLAAPIAGAGYYYSSYTAHDFTISSKLTTVSVERLGEMGVRASDTPSNVIEDFAGDWRRGWYTFDENDAWPLRTNKIQHAKWRGAKGARLVLEVRCSRPNTLVLEVDQHARECPLPGGDEWQTVAVGLADLKDALGAELGDWESANELTIGPRVTLRKGDVTKTLGADWQGDLPEFRQSRWEQRPGE